MKEQDDGHGRGASSSREKWEEIYQSGNMPCIPYTEVFSSIISIYGRQNLPGLKVLEVGCGAGNNLLFAGGRLGMEVYGIDFSASAVRYTQGLLDECGVDSVLKVGDACSLEFDSSFFDVVIDRAALQHNTFNKCKEIVSEVHRVLQPGGIFVLSATSEDHPLFGGGSGLGEGAFVNENEVGVRQFFSRNQIMEMMLNFKIEKWESHSRHDVCTGERLGCVYHICARKKS